MSANVLLPKDCYFLFETRNKEELSCWHAFANLKEKIGCKNGCSCQYFHALSESWPLPKMNPNENTSY